MAYKPKYQGNRRDKTYPSEIATQRPALAPRIHCVEDYQEFSGEESIRGTGRSESFNEYLRGPAHEADETELDRFNHALRSGHGFRNEGDE